MSENARLNKARRERASKQKRPQIVQVRVTDSSNVTSKVKETPSMRYRRLKPWLDLAGAAWPVTLTRDPLEVEEKFMARARPILTAARDTADFPAEAMRASLREPLLGSKRLFELADKVVSDLMFCGCETWLPEGQSMKVQGSIPRTGPGATVWLDRSAGRVGVTSFDPYCDYFLRALEGTETNRIRRCPICDSLFYARRLTQEACSQRCNATRRVRAWRVHQAKYEQTRKEKPETVKSESKTWGAKPRKEHGR